eukprot:TRINITY_DN46268_c0_g1_i1.p1 TRINITY_DN46268_c0_g1~~TRINITY_DN46268_c0_g1_i1.p1  ORF type:complete len:225 (+),score=33.35 TRINITY_DN46268_c0_g1_i1:25-675(+)
MQHLKECPLDKNCPWRPSTLQWAGTSLEHREDNATARNFFQRGQMVTKMTQPLGLEETVRMSVSGRTGNYATREELVNASYMPDGWKQYETLSKPDFNASFSFIRQGCRLTSAPDFPSPPASPVRAASVGRLTGGSGSPAASARSFLSGVSGASTTELLGLYHQASPGQAHGRREVDPKSTWRATNTAKHGLQTIIDSGRAAGCRDFYGKGAALGQ